MGAPAPVYRGQGNQPFQSFRRDGIQKRGQTVPYDTNGAPTPATPEPGALVLNVNDLPLADPSKPLFEAEIPAGGIVFTGVGNFLSAGVAASGATSLRVFKNGAANGTIDWAGAVGTSNLSDSTYDEDDLFGLYPPLVADATLDRLRITMGTD